MNPDPAEAELLERLGGAVVAVGEDDVVLFASTSALKLLGWDSSLIGQPLTIIIPRRLQSQHLAAFERYVQTGVSKLQGHPVRVPARHRRGNEMELDLAIRVFRRPDGTKLAVAVMSIPTPGVEPANLQVLESALKRRLYELV